MPVRTCVACRTTGGKRGLLRVVRLPGGEGLVLDPTGKRSGRGAYVCPSAECVALALKQKRLERSLKTPVPPEVAEALRAAVLPEEAEGETAATTG
ncbi:MAG TPA: YlxR family protein [Armatimonadaceae bacterium]|nr:YlxR family protein [Armatimonadaceae bacterium]